MAGRDKDVGTQKGIESNEMRDNKLRGSERKVRSNQGLRKWDLVTSD